MYALHVHVEGIIIMGIATEAIIIITISIFRPTSSPVLGLQTQFDPLMWLLTYVTIEQST